MEKEKPDILKKELNDIAPDISEVSKDNPFDVPGNYFSGLPEKVQNLKNSEPQKVYAGVLSISPRKLLAYASALLVLISFGISILFFTNNNDIDLYSEADNELFESYFSYFADYDETAYYDILAAEEIEHLEYPEGSFDFFTMDDELEDDAYFEYLLDYMDLYQYSPEDIAYFD